MVGGSETKLRRKERISPRMEKQRTRESLLERSSFLLESGWGGEKKKKLLRGKTQVKRIVFG